MTINLRTRASEEKGEDTADPGPGLPWLRVSPGKSMTDKPLPGGESLGAVGTLPPRPPRSPAGSWGAHPWEPRSRLTHQREPPVPGRFQQLFAFCSQFLFEVF